MAPEKSAILEVHIRDATEADVPAVHAVRVASWRAAYAGIVPDQVLSGMQVDDPRAIEAHRQRLRSPFPRSHLLVAEVGGGVVGFAAIGPEREATGELGSTPRRDAEDGEVYAIYLLPELQRRGIGHHLLRVALERLGVEGFRRAVLWVLEANAPARAFYERCGMTPTGRRQLIAIGIELPEIQYEIGLGAS